MLANVYVGYQSHLEWYGTPAVLGKTIEVTVTLDFKEGSVYASNIKTRSESWIIDYKVSLNTFTMNTLVRIMANMSKWHVNLEDPAVQGTGDGSVLTNKRCPIRWPQADNSRG